MNGLVELFKDPYERKARLVPGLLVVLPLLVPLVCVYGQRNPVLAAVVALLSSCGAMYGLASIVRGRGKKLEAQLVGAWGGLPSTIALRHRDGLLDKVTKRRYHELIIAKLGIDMPTPQQEADDPVSADDAYAGAATRLRELTRNNKGLLFKENIAYGFHRNMLAMKPAGVVLSLLGLIYGLILTKALRLTPPALSWEGLAEPGLAGALTLVVSIALLAAWLLYFDSHAVKRIADAYSQRLFECLPSLTAKAPAKKRAAKADQPAGAE